MKKRFLPMLAVVCMTAALLPGTVLASNRSTSTQVEKRTEEDIQKYFRSHSFDMKQKDVMSTETDVSKDEAGKLSDETVQNALNALNFIRYIAGIPEVTNNTQYEEYAQAGAALMQHINKLTHTPAKPTDVSQEFYDKAYKGTSSSNIAWSSGGHLNLASTVIKSWMSDEDEGNIDRVGHRRWCINPNMKQTGFGRSEGYSAIYAFDNTFASSKYEYVPWPAQVMPVEYFYGPWSVSLNSNVYTTTDNIEVTLSNGEEEYVLNKACTDTGGKYFNVDTANYGMGPAIIFEPVGPSGYGNYNETFSAGDEVSVKITGLKNKNNEDTSIEYTVNFFSMEAMEEPSNITLNENSHEMKEGENFQLKVTDGSTATWTSSNNTVATVNSNGLVTAVKEGTATITAKVGKLTAECVITVTKEKKPSLNSTSEEIEVGKTFQLKVTDNSTATWTSSNNTVATVNSNGLVTAVKEGTATITAKVGKLTAECVITVTKEKKPSLNSTSEEIEVGKTFQLKVTNDSTATWTSSNNTVATVNSNGLVTAVKEGTATITAKVGNSTAKCVITVTKEKKPSLNSTSEEIEVGKTFQLKVTDDSTATWTSSNNAVATVDSNGLVTAVKKGTAIITATVEDAIATCTITVAEPEKTKKISLNFTSYNMDTTETLKLKATTSGFDSAPEITWTSSDSKIATVDKNGNVKPVKEGSVTITAKAGNVKAECVVKISAPDENPDEIKLNYSKYELKVGKTVQLKVVKTASSSNASPKTEWSSTDSSIAEVDDDGVVTAVKRGTATITAKVDDLTATCKITVISSSGSSSSSSSGSKRSKTDSTQNAVNKGSSSRPSYVVQGAWNQNADGSWNFTDSTGKAYKNSWGAVVNPYANTAAGQTDFDWFFFDENGKMRTGWFVDTDGNTYYLNENSDGTRGRMMTGWCWVVDAMGVQRCYYLNPISDGTKGKLLVNTVIDGYTINEKGEWTVNGVVQTK